MTPSEKYSLCGWVSNPAERDRMAALQHTPILQSALRDTGKGKDIFLWQIEEAITGRPARDPHNQTIGDCVSHGMSGAAEDLLYIQLHLGQSDKWEAIASEAIYSGARHQIGKDQCGRGDGAVVGWAIEWGQKFGFLPRRKYPNADLTTYDGNRAKTWGAPGAGCPSELAEAAKHFPVKTASLIEGPNYYEQARDVIANGGLVVTGSETLYSDVRDQYGFCQPQGRGGHCTYYRGVTDNPRRPGIGYQQSWGNAMPRGPQKVRLPHGVDVTLPFGCFFIDAENFDRMHRGQEVWAITHMDGWEPLPDDWTIRFL